MNIRPLGRYGQGALSLAAALCLAAAAHAASITTSIPITNAGFESPATSSFLVTVPTGWTGSGQVVVQNESSSTMPTDDDGLNWLILDSRAGGGSVYQQVGAVASNTIYDLSMLLGARDPGALALPADYIFGLYVDNDDNGSPETVLASADKSAFTPTFATPISGAVQYDSASSAYLGKDLYVRMFIPSAAADSDAHQVLFDDVALTASVRAPGPKVVNGSFELPAAPSSPGYTTSGPSDWVDEGPNNRSVVQRDTSGDLPDAPDGDQWLILDTRETPGAVHQNIGLINEGEIYTMDITVGQRGDQPLPETFEFGLWADDQTDPSVPDTVLVMLTESALSLPSPGTAGSQTLRLVWDSTGSGLDGYNLFVRLAATTASDSSTVRQVLFDAVSVTIPTPAALPAGLVMIGLISLRRRAR